MSKESSNVYIQLLRIAPAPYNRIENEKEVAYDKYYNMQLSELVAPQRKEWKKKRKESASGIVICR